MNRYPSDEELNQWIEELEKEELYAPAHLKEEILSEAARLSSKKDMGSKERRGQPVSLFSYTLKIAAGMAAALFLVFAVPISNGSNLSYAGVRKEAGDVSEQRANGANEEGPDRKRERFSEKLTEKTGAVGCAVRELTGQITDKFMTNRLGGYEYEN